MTQNEIAETMGPSTKYGNRNITKMLREFDSLRAAIRAEGTPQIQDAFDKVEPWADFMFGREK